MERLTLIETDDMGAMHPRCFDALTHGDILQQVRDWIDRLLPSGPPTTFRLSFLPELHTATALRHQDGRWVVALLYRGAVRTESPYDTFTEAAAFFVSLALREGNHWSEPAPRPRLGDELATIRLPKVLAWVRQAASHIETLQARLAAAAGAAGAAIDALREGDVAAAMTILATAQERGPGLLAALRAMADLLDAVADDDPPSYVTSLETHARAVVVAAGLRPARTRPEDEPLAA
jgi:hypothetical protein